MGRACVLTDTCAAETKALIEKELSDHVKLIHNKTGYMYGATHAKEFLPQFIGPESRKLKTLLQLRPSDPYFYGEDHAPGHYFDNCSVTKETGLNAIRKDFFMKTNGHRKLTPKRGTPRFGVVDQIHSWIKDLIHEEGTGPTWRHDRRRFDEDGRQIVVGVGRHVCHIKRVQTGGHVISLLPRSCQGSRDPFEEAVRRLGCFLQMRFL